MGQKFNVQNIYVLIIKGMISTPGYTENVYPMIQLVTYGWGQKVKYHLISSRAWGFAMVRHRMCSSLKLFG